MALTGGCSLDSPEGLLESDQQELYGDVNFASDCSQEHIDILSDSMQRGRIASNTPAFEQCVRQQITNLYTPCAGDPFASSGVAEQIDRALQSTRTTNGVDITCTGGSGNASAAIGSWGHSNGEAFSWSGWLDAAVAGQAEGICGQAGSNPSSCRDAGWPWSQVAGTIWHEVSHTHGYGHDSCGISDPNWDFQTNTIPYIVGDCLAQTVLESADACGEDAWCGTDSIEMVDQLGSTNCVCARDPADPWTDQKLGEHKQWYIGDFDGDGDDDILRAVDRWGGAEVLLNDGEHFESAGVWSGAGFYSHRWYVGDFDGDGADDIMRKSHKYGGAQVFLSNRQDKFVYDGTWTGAGTFGHRWYVGDFDGDGDDDIFRLSHEDGGAEVLLSNQDNAFVPDGVWTGAGIRGHRWYVGDFDGDKDDDILRIASKWGGAQVFLSDGHSAFTGGAKWTGAGFYSHRWYVGDFDGDGDDDISRLSHSSGGAQVLLSNRSNAFVYDGTWTGAGIHGHRWYVGKFDDNNRSDLLRLSSPDGGAEVLKSDGSEEFRR